MWCLIQVVKNGQNVMYSFRYVIISIADHYQECFRKLQKSPKSNLNFTRNHVITC